VHNVLERVDLLTTEGPQHAWVVATNVYLKTTQGWRLAAHHASPGRSEVAEVTIPGQLLH
jgi:ketosteroid isomerase-like protein